MTRRIPLTKGMEALVDDEDYETVTKYSWYGFDSTRTSYAKHTSQVDGKKTRFYMHQLLMGDPPSPGLEVDHHNGNGLDNRRNNLRWVTRQQNMGNRRKTGGSSRYKGVTWDKNRIKWIAQLTVDYKRIYLGGFCSEEAAARAYDAAALEKFGEFARLNFPTKEKANVEG